MIKKLTVTEFLNNPGSPLIDVRSPAEYRHAHIPGAVNIPLFTDEERKIVGTAYKQESREKAIKLGLDFFGPKMKSIVETVEELSSGHATRELYLYCWRGGMRSGAIAWLLDLYGFKVHTLMGGYKSYRRLVLDAFSHPYPFSLLGGYTGSGKTELLHELKKRNRSVIDLEAIASHKGSAFGNLGMPEQPGQEMFENLVFTELEKHKNAEQIWLEDESQRLGHVNLPNDFWKTMRESPVYFLDVPFEERLDHIVREYGSFPQDRLINAIERIREKLGPQNAKAAIEVLVSGSTKESFRILLEYYDKFYRRALHNRNNLNSLLHSIPCKSISSENANQLIHYHQQQGLQQA